MKRLAQIIVILIAVLIVVIAGLFVYLFALDGLESIINSRLAALVDSRFHVEMHIGRVTGDILSGMVLEDVQIQYVDSLHRYQLARIPRITTAYAISNLWRRNFLFEYLFLDSAEITLVRDSVDGWLLPAIPARSDTAEALAAPSFAVEMLGLNDVTINIIDGDDTLGIKDINLVLALQSSEGTYGISVERLEFTSADQRLRLDAAGGKLTYGSGQLMLKDLLLNSDETHLKLSGMVGVTQPLSAALSFDLNNLDLERLTSFVGPRLKGVVDLNGQVSLQNGELSGSVDVGGQFMMASLENLHADFRWSEKHLYLDSLYGTILGRCAIHGRGDIDFSDKPERYHLSADLRDFDIKELVTSSFESDFNGRIVVDGESFRKQTLVMRVTTELFDSEYHGYSFHRGAGELVVTTDSLVFVDPYQIDYHENTFLVAGRIQYRSETDLTVSADLRNLERYQSKLFVDRPAGRGRVEAQVCGLTSNPDLKGRFESDSLWLYDFFSRDVGAEFDIKRFLTGREGFVQVTCFDGNAYGFPFDTCYSFLTLDSDVVVIDTAHLDNEFASVATHGRLNYLTYPMQLDFDTLALELFDVEFYNRLPLIIEIDSLGFKFNQAAIVDDGAMIAASGRADYDQSLDLEIQAVQVAAGPWVSLFDEQLPVDGRVSCSLGVQGTIAEPRLDVHASVDSLVYRSLVLGKLAVDARYDNQRLDIDSMIVLSDPGRYRAEGFMHMDLAFTSGPMERFPDQPMDIHFSATDRRFDLVSLVLPSVERLEGDFAADFTLSGSPNAPVLQGEAYITDASLKYFDLVDTIFTDSAGVNMHNDVIAIEMIEARGSERNQPVYLNGEITVKSLDNLHYNVDVSIPNPFPVRYELDDISGRIKARFHVGGDSPPMVTGDVELVSMMYRANFAQENEGSPIMAALAQENSWDLDLAIDIPSNYWIKNEDLDAEMSGELNLVREDGIYRFIGEMEFVRGSGFLFDKKLRIDQGGRVIFEGNERLNPQLDITGRTRIMGESQSPIDGQDAVREEIELCVHATGTLDYPEIDPCPESQMTREEIIPLLVANYYTSDSVTATNRFEDRISGLVGSEISKIGGRSLNKLGVETFEIDPYYEGQFDPLKARVTVGFYTARNLYVYGSSALSFESLQEVGFDYRFSKKMVLEGRSDEDELYRLALKLHWEF